MFYRGMTLKRWVAGLSLALALLPCFQQSHAVCRLAGCAMQWAATMTDDFVVANSGCGKCCGEGEESPRELPASNHDGLPCGPDCCCCQPIDPREAPRDTTESAKSHIVSDCVCVIVKPNPAWQADLLNANSFALARMPATTSADICARLCRLLT